MKRSVNEEIIISSILFGFSQIMEAKIETKERQDKKSNDSKMKLLDKVNLFKKFHFIEFEHFNLALWYDLNNYCYIVEAMKNIQKKTIIEIMLKLNSAMAYIINSNPYVKENNLVNSTFLISRINCVLKNYL